MCWPAIIFASNIDTVLSSDDWTVIFDSIYWTFLLFENEYNEIFLLALVAHFIKLFGNIIELFKIFLMSIFLFMIKDIN